MVRGCRVWFSRPARAVERKSASSRARPWCSAALAVQARSRRCAPCSPSSQRRSPPAPSSSSWRFQLLLYSLRSLSPRDKSPRRSSRGRRWTSRSNTTSPCSSADHRRAPRSALQLAQCRVWFNRPARAVERKSASIPAFRSFFAATVAPVPSSSHRSRHGAPSGHWRVTRFPPASSSSSWPFPLLLSSLLLAWPRCK